MFYFDKLLGKSVLKSDYLSSLNHFFTTKELILKTKEDEKIEESFLNRENIIKEFKLKKLLFPSQTHTSNVDFANFSKNSYEETDALILADKEIGIFLNFADCTPVILYDIKKRCGAIVHAGWRGTVGKIVQKTFFKMESELGCFASDIVAVIGPCICFDCFETSNEIMNMLLSTVQNKENCCKAEDDKFYADLKEINKRQLEDIGINKVDVAPFCTNCNNDKFFSYRKEKKTTNRMSAFISL